MLFLLKVDNNSDRNTVRERNAMKMSKYASNILTYPVQYLSAEHELVPIKSIRMQANWFDGMQSH